MTAPVTRPDEARTIANLMERVRALEAVIPGAGGNGCCDPTVVNPGNVVIDDQFADCVGLGGSGITFPDTVVTFTPAPAELGATRFPIGPYRCNYEAGFRLQMGFAGNYERIGLYGQIFHLNVPIGAPWIISTPPGVTTPTIIHTPWATAPPDPSGTGALGDAWQAAIYVQNGSIINNGLIGGSLYSRYVPAGDHDAGGVPPPTAVGQMSISRAGGTGFYWELLPAGTAGQVLTMSAGVPTWV